MPVDHRRGIEVEAVAETFGPRGVEMEALTAWAVVALTIATGVGPILNETSVEDLELWEKSRGRSGTWVRS